MNQWTVLTHPARQRSIWNVFNQIIKGQVPEAPQSNRLLGGRSTTSAMKGHRILIVDDNHTALQALQTILTEAAFNCDLAGDGIEVLQALEHREYDCILMDLNMIYLSGDETTRILRHRERTLGKRHYPIIGMGTGEPLEAKVAAEAGMDKLLTKPLKQKELLDAIDQVILESKPANPCAKEGGSQADHMPADAHAPLHKDSHLPDAVKPQTVTKKEILEVSTFDILDY